MNNYFAVLNKIDVSKHIEKKGQFSYLSWPYAVAQLRLADPAATWEVKRFNGLPYLQTELGYFVEVAVTVQAVTLSQVHPVLDAKNHPIAMPTTFDINTSIQRALVKAIALHGLGLCVYAGEDLPAADVITIQQPQAPAEVSITIEQVARIKKLLGETGQSLQRFLAFFRVESIEKIPATEYERVIKTLENAKRRAA